MSLFVLPSVPDLDWAIDRLLFDDTPGFADEDAEHEAHLAGHKRTHRGRRRKAHHRKQDVAAKPASALPVMHLPLDILETPAAFELHADTPGMTPEEVKVELHEDVLTISGSRKLAREDKDASGKVWRSERSSYSFARSFTLPETANVEAISAKVDKGVLTVTVPKKEPEPRPGPKRIVVSRPEAKL